MTRHQAGNGMQVCAVSAIGFAEGPSHTNWKKVATILLWWFLGFFCVCGATYVLVAQGARSLFAPLAQLTPFGALGCVLCAAHDVLPPLPCALAPILCPPPLLHSLAVLCSWALQRWLADSPLAYQIRTKVVISFFSTAIPLLFLSHLFFCCV